MFESKTNKAGRPQGVQVGSATSQLRGSRLPPKRVVSLLPVEFFAVRFGNTDGEAHDGLFMRTQLPDGTYNWYMPPDGESYAATLRPPADWLVKELDKHVPARSIPDGDGAIPKDTGEV